MKTWKGWTVKEVRRLESLRLEGKSLAQIAAELGRTKASVSQRLSQEGIDRVRNQWRWLPLLMQPHNIGALAERLGVTKHAVKQAKRRLFRDSQGTTRNSSGGG